MPSEDLKPLRRSDKLHLNLQGGGFKKPAGEGKKNTPASPNEPPQTQECPSGRQDRGIEKSKTRSRGERGKLQKEKYKLGEKKKGQVNKEASEEGNQRQLPALRGSSPLKEKVETKTCKG